MDIPLNIPNNEGLFLSVIQTTNKQGKHHYSVAIMNATNDMACSETVPSYHRISTNKYKHTDNYDCGAWMEDYEIIEGDNLYDCIEKSLKQLVPLCDKSVDEYISCL